MIRFTCPWCEAALKVSDDRAGQPITCPGCDRSVPVPENPDDEPTADAPHGSRRRRVPLWVWGAAAFASVVLVVGAVVAVARSGPDDGLTRAERAELEAKMRRDLPGSWEDDGVGKKTVYAFTDDGRFEATRYELDAFRHPGGRKKIGGHVGTWSVSGSRMTLRVTESADDLVPTGKPVEMRIGEVKSENGSVFKFTLSRAGSAGESRTLAKPRVDELTTDEGKARRLVGAWDERTPPGWAEYEFRRDSTLRITLHLGTGDVWSTGTWRVESGVLRIWLLEHTNGPYPDPQKSAAWLFRESTPNRFVIESATTGNRMVLVRR